MATSHLEVIRPDGARRRRLSDSSPREMSWSRDGRFIAYSGYQSGRETVDVARRTTRIVGARGGSEAWSWRGHLLAFDGRDGLSVFDARSGTTRHLTFDHAGVIAWAPDDRSIAYLDGDIRIATISRSVRTIISTSGTAGGLISSLVWTRPATSLRYRPVEPRTAATVSGNELVAPWPVEHLAADGGHVLYVTCGTCSCGRPRPAKSFRQSAWHRSRPTARRPTTTSRSTSTTSRSRAIGLHSAPVPGT